MSKTFCPLPWNFQAVRNNGALRVCCQSNISKSRGILHSDSGQVYHASTASLDDARNAVELKEVRKNILNGVWSESCQRCKQEEEAGLNSRRIYEQDGWDLKFEDVVDKTTLNGEIDTQDFPVKYYDLRFGNLCNLKCRMCGPTDSSAWYEDWVELTGKKFFKDTQGKVDLVFDRGRYRTFDYDWHSSDHFWEQIEKNMEDTQFVYMAGGEPLLIKRHYDFLRKAIDLGVSKNMVLEYNTNATVLPNKVLGYWKEFEQIRLGASIDGFGKVFEYQRFPAQWDEVYQNLVKISELPKNVFSWLATTVTVYNIFHLPEFMKWKLKNERIKQINRTNRKPIITPHVAHRPDHLNIRVLPEELKKVATNRLYDFLDWLKDEGFDDHVMKQGGDIVSSVTNYMNSESYNEREWSYFVDYTKSLDKIRGENLVEVVPEFSEFF